MVRLHPQYIKERGEKMGICNYCDYKEFKKMMKNQKVKTKLTSEPLVNEETGEKVFPSGVRVVNSLTGADLGVWYAKLPDHCEC